MIRWFATVLAGLFLTAAAHALEPPRTTPVLTVTGAIDVTNDGPAALFDRAMLESLDWREIETFTSFTDGVQTFAGPTLESLLDALGVDSGTLQATALNDYTVEIPVAHAAEHDVLLAMDHNGRPMRVRDKGPIWVVYPQAEGQAATMSFDSQMIWQLNRIRVLP